MSWWKKIKPLSKQVFLTPLSIFQGQDQTCNKVKIKPNQPFTQLIGNV